MSRTPKAVYIWPGLPELLRLPTWGGLAVAVVFAFLLNLAIVSSLVWTELLPPVLRGAVWLAVVAFWTVSFAYSRSVEVRQRRLPKSNTAKEPLADVMKHYLRGNWYEAEHSLEVMLAKNSRDLEARLLLATLLRHTDRREEAGRQLDLLQRLEGSEVWEPEIQSERELLSEPRQDAEEAEESPVDSSAEESQVSAA